MQQNKAITTKKPYIPVVQVGIGIFIIKDDMILLGKRKGSHGSGQWSPPGGKPNIGEKFIDTAKREVLEETSLIVENLEFLTFSEDFFPQENLHFATFYYLSRSFTGEAKSMEPHKCEGWHWFPIANLPSPLFIIEPLIPTIMKIVSRDQKRH